MRLTRRTQKGGLGKEDYKQLYDGLNSLSPDTSKESMWPLVSIGIDILNHMNTGSYLDLFRSFSEYNEETWRPRVLPEQMEIVRNLFMPELIANHLLYLLDYNMYNDIRYRFLPVAPHFFSPSDMDARITQILNKRESSSFNPLTLSTQLLLSIIRDKYFTEDPLSATFYSVRNYGLNFAKKVCGGRGSKCKSMNDMILEVISFLSNTEKSQSYRKTFRQKPKAAPTRKGSPSYIPKPKGHVSPVESYMPGTYRVRLSPYEGDIYADFELPTSASLENKYRTEMELHHLISNKPKPSYIEWLHESKFRFFKNMYEERSVGRSDIPDYKIWLTTLYTKLRSHYVLQHKRTYTSTHPYYAREREMGRLHPETELPVHVQVLESILRIEFGLPEQTRRQPQSNIPTGTRRRRPGSPPPFQQGTTAPPRSASPSRTAAPRTAAPPRSASPPRTAQPSPYDEYEARFPREHGALLRQIRLATNGNLQGIRNSLSKKDLRLKTHSDQLQRIAGVNIPEGVNVGFYFKRMFPSE